MLLRCIHAENAKVKHSMLSFPLLLIPIIPAIMGTFNYLQNLEILQDGWYSLWTQITLFYACFFYAPLIGIYGSYLWRLEHTNHNWNTFMTMPVSITNRYLGKYILLIKITVFTQIWTALLFFISGKIAGIPGIPSPDIFFWLFRGTFAAMAIAAVQLFLSMIIRNFAIPIGIALIGSIGGMLLNNAGLGKFWPYSLMLLGMNSNKTEDSFSSMADTMTFLFSVLFFLTFFLVLAITKLKHTDIHA